MGTGDLIAAAVLVGLTVGWLLFRARTDRSVRAACLVMGGLQLFAGVWKLALSGIYDAYLGVDYIGLASLALGIVTLAFRQEWTLLVIAAVFLLSGVLNVVVAFQQDHYIAILWAGAQFVIAAMMIRFVARHRAAAGVSSGARG